MSVHRLAIPKLMFACRYRIKQTPGGGGRGTPLEEAHRDVPLDGVPFLRTYQCKFRGGGVGARGGDLMSETFPLSGF